MAETSSVAGDISVRSYPVDASSKTTQIWTVVLARAGCIRHFAVILEGHSFIGFALDLKELHFS